MRLGNDTITVRKPTVVTDTRDNTTVKHFNPPLTETPQQGCSVQPFLPATKLQFEVIAERLYSKSTWRVYAPSTTLTRGIEPEDEIEFLGVVYAVFGHVGEWRDQAGRPDHVEFIIEKREG